MELLDVWGTVKRFSIFVLQSKLPSQGGLIEGCEVGKIAKLAGIDLWHHA